MSENELDSLMRQADMSRKEAVEESMDWSPNERLFKRLSGAGLFVRDYDGVCQERLPRCIKDLHAEVCQIGSPEDLRQWLEMPVGQLLELYAKGTGLNWFEWMEDLSWREEDEPA